MVAVPSLDEIARDPGKAIALSCEVARDLYVQAAGVEAALRARLLTDSAASVTPVARVEADEWLSAEEVAKRFGLEPQWLKRHRALLRARRVLATPSRKKSVYHAARLRRLLEDRTAGSM